MNAQATTDTPPEDYSGITAGSQAGPFAWISGEQGVRAQVAARTRALSATESIVRRMREQRQDEARDRG